ncbi:MAG: DNA phosphorothioation-associated putative methyltransferase [Acidobacteria bacterium]|nr:DNA phosphorothioation-associated putative methyltransferase [Acidobacteriota bacterium]
MSRSTAAKTAISRWSISRPVALALEDGLISKETTFFDYGCGRGGDIRRLHDMGIEVSGWDPAYFPEEERTPADVVNLGYVINVIEDLEERAVVLHAAWSLARRVLVVSARLEWEARQIAGDYQGDGIVTRKRTFQKFYTQEELRDWIKAVLDHDVVAAAPGIFYLFRDPTEEQAFVASRVARRQPRPSVRFSEAEFKANKRLLEPLMDFVADRGRLPVDGEFPETAKIKRVFGGVPRAFSHVRRVTGTEEWDAIRRRRTEDTLVYLALAAFPKRPRFGALPSDLRNDIRAFFGSYKKACLQADALLYSAGNLKAVSAACETAVVGKLLPEALYIHHTALPRIPAVLRVYEGCGRQLVGAIDGMTLVKLSRHKPTVSYLVYPEFDSDGHPALAEAFTADLGRLRLYRRQYRDSPNPPILHRKELFVSNDYPSRAKFARLTAQEESHGLYGTGRRIGHRLDWLALLSDRHLRLQGHRLSVHQLH